MSCINVLLTKVPLLSILSQGDPVSDYLFTFVLEVAVILITTKNKIDSLTNYGHNFL